MGRFAVKKVNVIDKCAGNTGAPLRYTVPLSSKRGALARTDAGNTGSGRAFGIVYMADFCRGLRAHQTNGGERWQDGTFARTGAGNTGTDGSFEMVYCRGLCAHQINGGERW